MIGVLSRHLPNAIRHLNGPHGDCILELIFLVESARYHQQNFVKLNSRDGLAPADFQSGTDLRGANLDRIWCGVAAIIEFEAFLTTVKRSLDRAWWCLGERFASYIARI